MPIMKFIRNHEIYSGPVAVMLFPDTSALAIFGPHSEEKMAKLAQKLANISNFPVIARPAPDDPIRACCRYDTQIQDGVEGNIRNVGTADDTLNTEGQTIGAGFPNSGPDEVSGIGSADGTNRHGGNGGDPGDEGDTPGHDDKWEDWMSPMHTTRSIVDIQANKMTLPVQIVCNTQLIAGDPSSGHMQNQIQNPTFTKNGLRLRSTQDSKCSF
ncbi:hypothetical protein B0H13DRAFT_1901670 [Mycena leptocephala]|nr:hypothetical protein B0H13DRAFT_1901670 [Mycena leptocephala]